MYVLYTYIIRVIMSCCVKELKDEIPEMRGRYAVNSY